MCIEKNTTAEGAATLSGEELDRALKEAILSLSGEKKAILLEWVKKEFPESEEHEKGEMFR